MGTLVKYDFKGRMPSRIIFFVMLGIINTTAFLYYRTLNPYTFFVFSLGMAACVLDAAMLFYSDIFSPGSNLVMMLPLKPYKLLLSRIISSFIELSSFLCLILLSFVPEALRTWMTDGLRADLYIRTFVKNHLNAGMAFYSLLVYFLWFILAFAFCLAFSRPLSLSKKGRIFFAVIFTGVFYALVKEMVYGVMRCFFPGFKQFYQGFSGSTFLYSLLTGSDIVRPLVIESSMYLIISAALFVFIVKLLDFSSVKKSLISKCYAFVAFILFVNVFVIIVSNSSTADEIKPKKILTIENQDLNSLAKLKNPYVGNHIKDSSITGQLPGSEIRKGMSINSEKLIYTVNYRYLKENPPQESVFDKNGLNETTLRRVFLNNAAALLILIDNVERINLNVMVEEGLSEYSLYSFSLSRDEAAKFFKRDLRKYAADTKLWQDEVINGTLNKEERLREFFKIHKISYKTLKGYDD